MAKKRAKIDQAEIFASTEKKRTSDVKGKSKITLYISEQVQDDLDEFWGRQPRQDRMSKSQITEQALIEWLERNG